MAAAIVPIIGAVTAIAPSVIQLIETFLKGASSKQKLDTAAAVTHTVTTTLADAGVIPQKDVPSISAMTDMVQTTFDGMKASGTLVESHATGPLINASATAPAELAIPTQPSGIAVGSVTPKPASGAVQSVKSIAVLAGLLNAAADAETQFPGVIQLFIKAVTA